MLSVVLMSEPKKRRSKGRKDTIGVTFRLTPDVKDALTRISDLTGKSENLQVEICIKIGFLYALGVNVYGMTEGQIALKFAELLETES